MDKKWHRVFAHMTRGADMRNVLKLSLALSTLSTLLTIPYFHYLLYKAPLSTSLSRNIGFRDDILVAELTMLFLIVFLSATTGFSFSRRLGLPSFGDPVRLIRFLPKLVLMGAVMIALSWFLFDRHFVRISPVSYPAEFVYLMSFPLKGALAGEIILRFCMVTLAVGVLKSRSKAVVVVSVFASLLTLKYFNFIRTGFDLSPLLITHLALSLCANLILGYLYVTKGLLYAMTLKFLFGMKYMIVAWGMG